jgi:hypothetical protein
LLKEKKAEIKKLNDDWSKSTRGGLQLIITSTVC